MTSTLHLDRLAFARYVYDCVLDAVPPSNEIARECRVEIVALEMQADGSVICEAESPWRSGGYCDWPSYSRASGAL